MEEREREMHCDEDWFRKEEWEWKERETENGLEKREREMHCDEDWFRKEEWEWKEREM